MNGSALPIVDDELDLLESLVPLVPARIVEPGCGAAQLARRLLQRYPQAEVVGLEVDVRQHAKNLASPAPGLTFSQAGAQRIPWPDGAFDGAMTLESLLHVPVDEMDRALAKTARRSCGRCTCGCCGVWGEPPVRDLMRRGPRRRRRDGRAASDRAASVSFAGRGVPRA
jgi:SAM-dependent methyltransferase